MDTICRHIKTSGQRCGSPALRVSPLCHCHDKFHNVGVEPNLKYGPLPLPAPDEAAAIHLSIARIHDTIVNDPTPTPAEKTDCETVKPFFPNQINHLHEKISQSHSFCEPVKLWSEIESNTNFNPASDLFLPLLSCSLAPLHPCYLVPLVPCSLVPCFLVPLFPWSLFQEMRRAESYHNAPPSHKTCNSSRLPLLSALETGLQSRWVVNAG